MKPRSHVSWTVPAALASWLLFLFVLAPHSMAQPLAAHVEPASVSLAPGSSITFCAQVTGTGPFFYRWQKNGVNLPGQTNDCLALTNLTVMDGASYRATVFNAGGALESEEAVLTIAVPTLPGADEFADRTVIRVASNTVSGASFAATRQPGEPQYLGLRTSNSVWYSWHAPATGIVTFDTRGSTFDTVLSVYMGSAVDALREVTSDDDSGGFHTSRVSWNAQANVDYRVVIDGVTGETGTYICHWNLEETSARLPEITLQPRSQTVLPGGTASFTTRVSDPDLYLEFQWFRNGQRLTGATSSNLTVNGVQSTNLGQYQLAITNSSGRGVVSALVDLEIGPDPTVQSRDKVAEVPVPEGGGGGGGFIPASVSGGTFSLAAGTIINQRFFNGGTMDRCEPAHCSVPGGASRWFQLSATADGVCTVDTANSDVDTVLAVYVQNFSICTNLFEPLVDCNNDAVGSCDQIMASGSIRDRTSRLSFFATAGTVYRAVVDTAGGVRGTNMQFNVRFESTASVPTNTVHLATATNCVLQLRGSSVTLQVAPNFVASGNTYQWRFNGRRIAGATRDRLVLPKLNYADAARYSVLIQNGTTNILLPGAAILVLDPCEPNGQSALPLVGATPEPMVLEASRVLNATSSWQVIGPVPASTDPTLWDVGTGPTRFYRAVRPPP